MKADRINPMRFNGGSEGPAVGLRDDGTTVQVPYCTSEAWQHLMLRGRRTALMPAKSSAATVQALFDQLPDETDK